MRALAVPFLLALAGCMPWDDLSRCFGGACDAGARATIDADAGTLCFGNLLRDPGFEQGGADWSVDHGSLVLVPDGGRTGGMAARVCMTEAGSPDISLGQDLPEKPVRGAGYRMSAWVRTATEAPQTLRVRIEEIPRVSDWGSAVLVASTWQELRGDLGIQVGGNDIFLRASVQSLDPPVGACFLADDLCLSNLP